MTLRPIKSEADYKAALQEIERLWDAETGTPESDALEILVTLVEVYEKGRYDLPPPDPAAALEYFYESSRSYAGGGRTWFRYAADGYSTNVLPPPA